MSSRAQTSTSSSSSSSSTAAEHHHGRQGRELFKSAYSTELFDIKRRQLPTETSRAVRFVAYAAGAPSEDFIVQSKTERQDNKPRYMRKKKPPQDLYWVRGRVSQIEVSHDEMEQQASTYRVPGSGFYIPGAMGSQYASNMYTAGQQAGVQAGHQQHSGVMNGNARAAGDAPAGGPFASGAMPAG